MVGPGVFDTLGASIRGMKKAGFTNDKISVNPLYLGGAEGRI